MAPKDRRWEGGGCLGCLGLCALLIYMGYAAFHKAEARFEQNRFPNRVLVNGTIFRQEELFGVGPGGNETGLVIYRMNASSARRLAEDGPALKDEKSIRVAVGRAERDYYEWRRTPVDKRRREWRGRSRKGGESSPIARYLNQYGFGIDIDPSIVQQVDKALTSAGSYYAYGDGGSLIVIVPRQGRLIFAYAG